MRCPLGNTLFAFFLLGVAAFTYAQDTQDANDAPSGVRHDVRNEMPMGEMMHGLRRRAVVMDIDARVLAQEQVVVWNETHRKTAIPGNPVSIKLVGSNVAVVVQFTPYIRRNGQNVLVSQMQIWHDVPNQGVRYYTSIQTVPLEFNEPIYFFPLGQFPQADDSSLEIVLTVNPYTEPNVTETGTENNTGNEE